MKSDARSLLLCLHFCLRLQGTTADTFIRSRALRVFGYPTNRTPLTQTYFCQRRSIVSSTLFVVNDDCIIIIIYILIHLFRMCVCDCSHMRRTPYHVSSTSSFSSCSFPQKWRPNRTMWGEQCNRYEYRCLGARLPRIPFRAPFIIGYVYCTSYIVHTSKLLAATNIYGSFFFTHLFVSIWAIHIGAAHFIARPFPSSFRRNDLDATNSTGWYTDAIQF